MPDSVTAWGRNTQRGTGPTAKRDTSDRTATASTSQRCVRNLRARADQVAEARRWLRFVLDPGHPCLDDTQLVLSELVTNAIQHGSPGPDAMIRIAIRHAPRAWVFVSVTDAGRDDAPTTPVPAMAGLGAVHGRGLALVDALAVRWGGLRAGTGHFVYALVSALDQRRPT